MLRRELDVSYVAFCRTLPLDLQAAAYELPYRLRLAIAPNIPFSEVFGHEVTFAAPALFAEAMPRISPVKVRDAVLAHALAVIHGFGTDRLEDRQIAPSPELTEILRCMEEVQGRAFARVLGNPEGGTAGATETSEPDNEVERARRAMLVAIRTEQRLMAECTAVDFVCYEKTALGKAGIGTPASVALARAAGWTPSECLAVTKTLSSVWLGMQYHDDALDWEDDLRRESAWAVLLARGARGAFERHGAATSPTSARDEVLRSGILAQMLTRSWRRFRAARKHAHALGARTLAAWAKRKEDHARFLAEEETKNAGYAVRLYTLSPWLTEMAS